MADVVRVTEVIDHGGSRHLTSVSGGSLTEALSEVVRSSPYPSVHRDEPKWIAELWADLLSESNTSRGWCRYSWEWIE